ncbi:MAG TPA: inositol monophosphatase family protein [Kiritimatiellia bacterium]|nr:inositol monophosphatase family protein [Kiritimatiellia bacterium]HMP34600.1 inositol monophosphatase family protein [Kiritimatiellia bacterium]
MSTPDRSVDHLLAVCRDAARAAGLHALREKARRSEIHERFSHDVKLQLDREAQHTAVEAIHKVFPGDPVLGEEWTVDGATNGVEWILDPIDGTVNFFHGIPWWCSSVAVRVHGTVVAGSVYAPEFDHLYEASTDTPARCNGVTLKVAETRRLADALVVTGSEKELNPRDPPLATAQRLAPHVQKVRILGAAALDLCQVAVGSVDIFCQTGLYLWDVAAAGLIIQRAGGSFAIQPIAQPGRYACIAACHQDLADDVRAFLGADSV